MMFRAFRDRILLQEGDGGASGERPLPGGGTDSGGKVIRQGQDGQYYELVNGRWVLIPGMPGEGLTTDLRELGLVPLASIGGVENEPQATSAEDFATSGSIGRTRDRATAKANIDTSALWVDPNSGLLYTQDGKIAPQWVHESVYGEGGPGGDPYAGAANDRAERGLQEQIRQNRLQEAQDAIDNQRQRMMMRLEGAQYALPSGTQGHFPGLTPTSPLVRSGLAEPLRAQPVAFNADVGMDQGQIEQDLMRIRAAAGVG